MMHALFISIANPGSHSSALNKIFRANNLHEMIIPKGPPSDKIMGAFANTKHKSTPKPNKRNSQRKGKRTIKW